MAAIRNLKEDINLNIQFAIEINNQEEDDDEDGDDDIGRLAAFVAYEPGIVRHDDGHDNYDWDHHDGGDEDDYQSDDDDDNYNDDDDE